jgi:transcriptional regulator with XRE-family HTH domain
MELNTNKIRGLMAEKGITQADVAKKLNISQNSVGNKLQGKTKFTANEIGLLCNVFKVMPGIFFTGDVSLEETR